MSEVKRYGISAEGELVEEWGKDTDAVVYARDYDALRLQLSRAKEFMRHDHGCSADIGEEYRCRCGLTEFLKEVGE